MGMNRTLIVAFLLVVVITLGASFLRSTRETANRTADVVVSAMGAKDMTSEERANYLCYVHKNVVPLKEEIVKQLNCK